MAEFEKNKPFTLLELVVSPTVMNGLKSMKQAMKQVTKAEMKDFPPRRPTIKYVSLEPLIGGDVRPVWR